MKKYFSPVFALLLVVFSVTSANAQCYYNDSIAFNVINHRMRGTLGLGHVGKKYLEIDTSSFKAFDFLVGVKLNNGYIIKNSDFCLIPTKTNSSTLLSKVSKIKGVEVITNEMAGNLINYDKYSKKWIKVNFSLDSARKVEAKIGKRRLGTIYTISKPLFVGENDCFFWAGSYRGTLNGGSEFVHYRKKGKVWRFCETLRSWSI